MAKKTRYGTVRVFRDDGRSWDTPEEADDDLWLKPGTVSRACTTGERVLHHRYWLFRERDDGRNDIRIDHNRLCMEVAAAISAAADGNDADAAYRRCMEHINQQSKRCFDDGDGEIG